MMRVIAQKYRQNKQTFYSMVLPFSLVDECSKVLVYEKKEKYGYQRAIDPKHSNDIKNSVLRGDESLPTSIILSVNVEEFNEYLIPIDLNIKDTFTEFFEVKIPSSKIFRVVDGQHRLAGLREALLEQKNNKMLDTISDFPLNVIVVPVNSKERVKEVIIFRDINSKAKKLKTDLTLLAMYNYELLNKKDLSTETDLLKHLIIRTTQKLNENKNSVWYNGIQFDIHEKPLQGVIGVAPMVNSLRNLVKSYIDFKEIRWEEFNTLTTDEKIERLDSISIDIESLVSKAWNQVYLRWKSCFLSEYISQLNGFYYYKGSYIQKTAGVNAIHMILRENLKYHDGEFVLDEFIQILNSSPLESMDWLTGGPFAGLTSQSGFKVARDLILGL